MKYMKQKMAHDFKQFPELTANQMNLYYFESPHKQIFNDFKAKVLKVKDGDTIQLVWDERSFDFPMRFLDINTKEMSEDGGEKAKSWLVKRIEGEEVDITINKLNRVDKWGRLLGAVRFGGMDIGEEMMRNGLATRFDQRNEGKIPNLNLEMRVERWF